MFAGMDLMPTIWPCIFDVIEMEVLTLPLKVNPGWIREPRYRTIARYHT